MAKAIATELGLPQASSPSEMAMIAGRDDSQTEGESATVSGQSEMAWIFHCAGDAYGLVFGDLLESSYGLKLKDYNGLYLIVEGRLPAEPLSFNAEQVRIRLRRRWNQFESWFDMGSFQSHLPLVARRASVTEAFNVEEFLRIFSGRKVIEVRRPEPYIDNSNP